MGITLPDRRVVIADVERGQKGPHGVDEMILACARRDGRTVMISIPKDPGQAGVAQVAHYSRLLHGYRLHFSSEVGSKPARARPLASQAEGGNLFLVRAPWNDSYVTEMCAFTGLDMRGTFSDQVDASSRAYSLLAQRPAARGVPERPVVILGSEAG